MHYLVGTAGHPNVGDELITRTWLRELARRSPDSDVWLDCPNPGAAQALFSGEHSRLRCVDTLYRLCWEAPRETAWDVAAFVADALEDHGQAPRWLAGLEVVGEAGTVHLLGGGYVNDMWTRHLGLLAAVAWASRRGALTAVTGQGFAPLTDPSATLARRLLADIDVVDVRDAPTARLLGRPETHSGDDLWLADLDSLVDRERAGDLDVLVCVQGDLLDVDEDWLTAQCLRHLGRWGADPVRTAVVECIPRVDRPVYDRVRAFLPGVQFVPWIDVVRRGFPAAAHQRWFSTRFHPHLVAAWAGAAGVAVPVRPGYYDVKHGSLLEAGSPWSLLSSPGDDAEPGSGTRPSKRLARTAQRVRARKEEIAGWLYGPVPDRQLPTSTGAGMVVGA